ncbi:hypothetical protein PtA15_14A474 [Puccinia triticina]|uniref:Uncharacterized protein n=1 Tax=Puccinia triticina TaxID=208348 RepID=A0ABY7D3Y2_9BASI|nr:uncharacterized protein PtA15_14A474 [Puccinia triticina]WAQ91590.1 hypothetical protein PtA15_14A474 [Puccinia triticina]
MIPPRLAHQLQSLITRKLLESTVFNEFVARTDGAFHSIRLGLKEGWQEGDKNSSNDGKSSNDDQEEPKPNKTTHGSKSSSTDHGRPFHSTEEPQEPPKRTDQDKQRLDTEQKLHKLLDKLRRQQPKS